MKGFFYIFICCLYCRTFLFLFLEMKAFRRAREETTALILFLLMLFSQAKVSVALIQQLHCIIFIGQLHSQRCIPKLL